MHVPGAEAADRGILLPFLVKAYAEAELLPEKRGARTPGMREGRKGTQKSAGSCPRHRDAYGPFVYRDGDPAEPFHPLYRKDQLQSDPLPEDTI